MSLKSQVELYLLLPLLAGYALLSSFLLVLWWWRERHDEGPFMGY